MTEKKSPIGVFDSGYGGLTVLKELVKKMPEYDFLYLGDNARAPYGNRSFDTVYEYTLEAVKWFFEQGCHLVVLACNTASAKALRTIQQKDLPNLAPHKRVLGVIRPTAELIGHYSKSKSIGIMATEGTVLSQSYILEIGKFFPEIKVSQQACPTLVPIIENNEIDTQDELVFELGKAGIQVTQATISRDIKELKLVKVLGGNGEYKYASLRESDKNSFDKLVRFVKEVLLSIDYSENIICLKTVDGAGNLVAKVIDSLEEKEILGTIGGTDTVFVLMKNREDIPGFVERFGKLL